MEVGDLTVGAAELALYELLRQRLLSTVLVPVPAAGADWIVTPPAGATWELLHVKAILATSAVAANRSPVLRIRDNAGLDLDAYPAAAVVPASSAIEQGWESGLGTPATVILNVATMSEPPPLVPLGGSLRVLTGNLDVADQWSAIVLTVREWNLNAVLSAAEWYARKQAP